MAGGYDLEVKGELEDDSYRKKLAALVKYTQGAGQTMERALNIRAELKDNVTAKLKKIDIQKLNAKELKVVAQTEEARVRLDAVAAKDLKIEARLEVESARFMADLKRIKAQARAADALELRAEVKFQKALADLEAFEKAAEQNEIDIPVDVNKGSAAIQGLSTNLITAARGVEQVTSRMGTLALAAGGVGAAFAGVGLAIGGFGVSVASKLDSLRFGFERLAGGGKEASAQFDALVESAKATPFDVTQVAELGFRLKAAGRNSKTLVDDVNTLADALVVSGGGAEQLQGILFAIQQTASTGLVNQQDLRQLNNNITGLGLGMDDLNKYVAEAKKQGFKGSDALVQGLFIAFKRIPFAAGAAADATTQTFAGKFSNFKDAIQLQFTDAFTPNKEKLFGAMDTVAGAIGPALEDLAPKISNAFVALGPIIATIISSAAPLVGIFTEVFTVLGTRITPYMERFSRYINDANVNVEKLATVFGGLLAGGVLLKVGGLIAGVVTPLLGLGSSLGGIFGPLIGGLGGTATAAGGASSATGGLAAALGSLTGPLAIVVGTIALLGASVASVPGGFSRLKDSVSESIKGIAGPIKEVKETAVNLFNDIKAALQPIGEAFLNFQDRLASSGLIKNLVETFSSVFKGLGAALGPILMNAGRLIGVIIEVVSIISEPVWTVFGEIISGIGNAFEFLGKAIGGAFNFLRSVGESIGGVISKVPGLKSVGEAIQGIGEESDKSKDKTKEMSEEAKKAAEEAKKKFEELRDSIKEGFNVDTSAIDTSSFDAAKTSLDSLVSESKAKLENTQRLMSSGFGALVQFANEVGGEAGTTLMAQFAEKVGTDQGALNAFRSQLAQLKAQEILAEREAETIASDILKQESERQRGKDVGNIRRGRVDNANTGRVGLGPAPQKGFLSSLLDDISKSEAVTAANESAKAVESAFYDAFKKANLTKGIDESLKNFSSTINTKFTAALNLDTAVTAAVNRLLTNLYSGINFGINNLFGLSNPFLNISTALKTGLDAAVGEVNKFMGSIAALQGPMYTSGQALGKAFADGLNSGFQSLAGPALGDSVYRSLANQYNKVATSLENAVASVKANLAGSGVKEFSPPFLSAAGFKLPRLEFGTTNWRGGAATMNERGPEPVILPRGSKVIPHHKAEDFMKGGGDTIYQEWHLNAVSNEEIVARVLAEQAAAGKRRLNRSN